MKYYFPCKPNQIDVDSDMFKELDSDPNWIAEVKLNGHRCVVYTDSETPLWSRHKTVINDALPEIRKQLAKLPKGCILDGEIISKRPKNWEKFLYLFDIIMWEGKLVTDLTLKQRKEILRKVYEQYLRWCPAIVLAVPVLIGKRKLYYDSIGDALREGIVMKRLDSKYIVSVRSCQQNPYWIKVKKPDAMFKAEQGK